MSSEADFFNSGGEDPAYEELFSQEQLDQEWADFNARIADDESQQEGDGLEREMKETTLDWKLYDQLDERDMPRLIDEDEAGEATRRTAYIERFYQNALADISWMRQDSEGTDTLPYLDKALMGVVAYVRESRVQRIIVSRAVGLLHDEMNGNSDQVAAQKKATQAELRVHYKLSFDDPWMQFFDEVTPGCGIISLSHPADKPYIEAAEAGLEKFDEDNYKELLVLETIIDLATHDKQPDFWGNTSKVARVLAAIAKLRTIVTADSGDEYGAEARRNQELWHYGYTSDLDKGVLREIIEYLELSDAVET